MSIVTFPEEALVAGQGGGEVVLDVDVGVVGDVETDAEASPSVTSRPADRR